MSLANPRRRSGSFIRTGNTKQSRRTKFRVETLEGRCLLTSYRSAGPFAGYGANPGGPALIITFGPFGAITTADGPGAGTPYDGADDSYIGVVNHSGAPVTSLTLHGSSGFTGFDGDGITTYGAPGNGGAPNSTTGYEGPETSFSNYTASGTSLTITFLDGGMPDNTQTFFSLELPPKDLNVAPVYPPPAVTPPTNPAAVEGAKSAIDLGSFTDAGPGPWAVDVSWGDGTPDTTFMTSNRGPLGTQDHTYGEEGKYAAMVQVTDTGDNKSGSAKFSVPVSDPAVKASGVPVFGVECRPLTGVILGSFTDPGGAEPNASDPGALASHYRVASIDWGDGTALDTTSGGIAYAGAPGSTTDSFTVTGSHTYNLEGNYPITVIIDHEGVQTTVITSAVVKDDLGLLLLDPTGSKSLMVTGNGIVDVSGTCGAVVVDSNSNDAAFVTGNSVVTAGDFDVTGGVKSTGNAVVPSPVDHETPTSDPLGLGLPSPLPPAPVGNTATVLHPGTYVGGLNFSGGAVTLTPGVYVMKGGGFSVSGTASVTGTGGVVIINIPGKSSDNISVTGQGVVSLSAPTSGPYRGVAVFQDPASGNAIALSGQANVTMAGVFYAPDAQVNITGDAIVTVNPGAGTATLPPISAAMIAFDLKVDGNGDLSINPDGPSAGAAARSVGAAGAHDAAIAVLVGGGGSAGSVAMADPELINGMAASLAGGADLLNWATAGAKKTR